MVLLLVGCASQLLSADDRLWRGFAPPLLAHAPVDAELLLIMKMPAPLWRTLELASVLMNVDADLTQPPSMSA
ncbi:MAG: hypothetical protein ABT20_12060 [Rubrivivax sp. SCN 70-15]|nr:MAG: hypothetical protein ABT20_12060 [Rubrivivax sp. SCN 70-15]